jgi:hypothetical protein
MVRSASIIKCIWHNYHCTKKINELLPKDGTLLFLRTRIQLESRASPFGAKKRTRDTHQLAGDDLSIEVWSSRRKPQKQLNTRVRYVVGSPHHKTHRRGSRLLPWTPRTALREHALQWRMQQSRRVEHETGRTSIRIEMCARRPFSVPKSCCRCIVTSIHRIDLHKKNLICGCHTTRGVKQPYTPTEALRHRGVTSVPGS